MPRPIGIDMRGAIELLFAPGFSTAETTSDISGRGVGMDAVRAKIRAARGRGRDGLHAGATGTLAQIRLPLTLAIVSALQSTSPARRSRSRSTAWSARCALTQQTVRSIAGRRCSFSTTVCCRCWRARPCSTASRRATTASRSSSVAGTTASALAVDASGRPARAGHPPAAPRSSPTASRSPAARRWPTADRPDRRLRRPRVEQLTAVVRSTPATPSRGLSAA